MRDLPSIDFRGEDFILHLPNSNRTLAVPANTHGVGYLKKIIAEAKKERGLNGQLKGHIRDFPTQHVVDAWIKQDRARKDADAAEARIAERAKIEETYGIDLNKLEINI
jgi:hypothetical protein